VCQQPFFSLSHVGQYTGLVLSQQGVC
jgi:phosphopantetheinyl transferase